MMSLLQEIDRRTKKLESLFLKVQEIKDHELKSHFASYLCVLVSGHIEHYLRIVLKQYVKDNAAPPIICFVEKKLTGSAI